MTTQIAPSQDYQSSKLSLVNFILDTVHQRGLLYWEEFERTPIGSMKMRYVSSPQYLAQAKELFAIGFVNGYLNNQQRDSQQLTETFENCWESVLGNSDDSVSDFPSDAEQYFRFGFTYGLNRAQS